MPIVERLRELVMRFVERHPELGGDEDVLAFVTSLQAKGAQLKVTEAEGSGDLVGSLEQRHVELYLGFPISPDLRDAFEDYLEDHPRRSEEDAAAHLLERGLEAVRDRSVLRPRNACRERMAKLRALLAVSHDDAV